MKKRVLIFLMVLFLCGCKGRDPRQEKGDRPIVYTSFFPVYDLVNMVSGGLLDVRSFMPEDKDAHLWEPSAKDMKELAKADLLVVNGANMESWVDSVRENFPDLDILVLSDSVELITYKGAAAIGDFQYMADLNLKKNETYRFDFSHTHEDVMRVAFFKKKEKDLKDLVSRGKKIMEDKGTLTPQNSTIEVEEGKVYGLEMAHEQGEIFFKVPQDGHWVLVSDRISEELLPYRITDENGEELKDSGLLQPLLEGSSSRMDKFTYDPHSWMSVVNAKRYINSIQDKFIEKYPRHERQFRKNKLKYVDALTDLEASYKEKFKEVPNREFLVMHYAYAYLARDFDLIQYPLQGLTSLEDPSLKTIKKAVDFARDKQLKTVFYEFGAPPKGALALAEEIGGKVSPLASMEYRTKEMKEKKMNYVDLMTMNLENLYESMAEGGTHEGH